MSFARHVTVRQTRDTSAWAAFAPYHYKSHSIGIVDKLFVMELGGEPIGLAVLGYPTGQLALRNQVTGGRYAGGRLTRSARLRRLNREVRTITRVVLRPEFRGCGLASRLVRHVLDNAGVPVVEALAAMGQVNRFFERAGMTRVGKVRRSAVHRRLAVCFLQAGATQADLCNPDRLAQVHDQADPSHRRTLDAALEKFFRACVGKAASGALTPKTRTRALAKAAAALMPEPVYYLWTKRPRSEERG